MKDSTWDGLIEEIAHETTHFAAAPAAFFNAWKSGVALAGTRFFGRELPQTWNTPPACGTCVPRFN